VIIQILGLLSTTQRANAKELCPKTLICRTNLSPDETGINRQRKIKGEMLRVLELGKAQNRWLGEKRGLIT
jgi:hypothetical protein